MQSACLLICAVAFSQDIHGASFGGFVAETKAYKEVIEDKDVVFPRRDGLVIVGIFPYGPLPAAKVNPFDIVIGINGQPVASTAEWDAVMKQLVPGEKAKLELLPFKTGKKLTWGVLKKVQVEVMSHSDIALASVRREKDEVTGITTVWHKDTPTSPFKSGNSLDFYFKLDREAAQPLILRVCSTGSSWLFVEKLTISSDDDRKEIDLSNQKWGREVGGRQVWEWCDTKVTPQIFTAIEPILKRPKVTLRCNGDTYKHDRDFTAEERSRMLTILTAYESHGGKLPK